SLPNLATLKGQVSGGFNGNASVQISADTAGQVLLQGLSTNSGGATSLFATDANSIVDVSALTNLVCDIGNHNSAIQATQGGRINATAMVSITNAAVQATQN